VLLAIDTSAGTSVAVVDRDRGIIAQRSEHDTRSHAEVIGNLIVDCLAESAVPIAALSAVAVGMGPGPFTGLRVGIAAAQAFALGAGKPIVRVVSHDAIAFGRYADGFSGPLLVVTDARRREVYWSAYSGPDAAGLPQRVGEPGLARPDDLPDAVPGYAGYERLDAQQVSAGSLGMLAETLYLNGRPFAGATPLYLRSPDVTVPHGPKRVSQ
jgi:tRNA threonylcarbamoyl adenosine modification protein YeaZ